MLPGRSGLQVLRDLRARKGNLRVLVLTAKDAIEERIAGLDAGADDYMVKPFVLAEVSARLRALLRRGEPSLIRLRVADLEMDVIRRAVTRGGSRIDLRPKEYALLEFLMRTATAAAALDDHRACLGHSFRQHQQRRRIHINALRNKIDRGFAVPLIHTIRGVGYMLSEHAP